MVTDGGIPTFGGYFPAWREAIHAAHAEMMHERVLAFVRACGAEGATVPEIARGRSLRPFRAEALVRALAVAGALAATGGTRRNRFGVAHPVYAAAKGATDAGA